MIGTSPLPTPRRPATSRLGRESRRRDVFRDVRRASCPRVFREARVFVGSLPERARERAPTAPRALRGGRRDGRSFPETLGTEFAREHGTGRARGVRGVGEEHADEHAGQQNPLRSSVLAAPPVRVSGHDARARRRRGRRPRPTSPGVGQIRVLGRVPNARRVRVAASHLRQSRSDDGCVHDEKGSARPIRADAASHAGARISGDGSGRKQGCESKGSLRLTFQRMETAIVCYFPPCNHVLTPTQNLRRFAPGSSHGLGTGTISTSFSRLPRAAVIL